MKYWPFESGLKLISNDENSVCIHLCVYNKYVSRLGGFYYSCGPAENPPKVTDLTLAKV